jgi:hypothetical protein
MDIKVYEGNSFKFAKNGGATSYDQSTYVQNSIILQQKLYFAPTNDSPRNVQY